MMKVMKCKELGGACNLEFKAESFDEIVEMSKNHGKEMFQKNDKQHLEAMGNMSEMMKNPEEFARWFEGRKKAFEDLPHVS